jgi:hypothetical protein
MASEASSYLNGSDVVSDFSRETVVADSKQIIDGGYTSW